MEEKFKNLTLKEIQYEDLEIFKKTKDFFEKNNLTYYICGGTLLGAIRHKGFIPWDDDIDILMPRPEYEKFKNILKQQECKINEELYVSSHDLGNSFYPYCKVCNKNIEIDTLLQKKYEHHLFIDIFPMDGLPNNKKERIKLFRKVKFRAHLLVTPFYKKESINNSDNAKIKKIFKHIIRILFKEPIIKFLANNIQKISQKYNYNDSEIVGALVWGYGENESLFRSEVTNKMVEFEGIQVNTFSCYEKYLSNLYGNYMELPPVEKRFAHSIKARKLLEN